MATSKKHYLTFKEFAEEQRKQQGKNPKDQSVNWEERKHKWIAAIDRLYLLMDKYVTDSYRKAGFNVSTRREQITLHEDFIGSYNIDNYIIELGT